MFILNVILGLLMYLIFTHILFTTLSAVRNGGREWAATIYDVILIQYFFTQCLKEANTVIVLLLLL